MSILNFLPKFKVVEINRSTGLVSGHVIAQFPLDITNSTAILTEKEGINFLENGFIVELNEDLEVVPYVTNSTRQPFLVFVEELNTMFSGLKYYATEEDAHGEIYPRGIGLYAGDVFTTDNVDTTAKGKFAKVVDGKLTLQLAADTNTSFAVEESTLPDGSEAYRFVYIGK